MQARSSAPAPRRPRYVQYRAIRAAVHLSRKIRRPNGGEYNSARRGGRRGRGAGSEPNNYAPTPARERSLLGVGRDSSDSDEMDEEEFARDFFRAVGDGSWTYDSLAEQLAGHRQQHVDEEGDEEEEEVEFDDFESRYYYDSDEDESDSMFFANLYAVEAAVSSRGRARRSRPARPSPAAAAPPPPPPPPEPVLCRFFVLGKCRYGSHCTYSHALPEAASDCAASPEEGLHAAAALVDCPFFQRGNCKYGDYCRLRHANAGSSSIRTTAAVPPPARSNRASAATPSENQTQEFTCGICFEDIVQAGKHFGLLSCDHCFCLDCLRSWRQAKDLEVEVIRACPACRQPSDFVVPSLTFCTGDAKAHTVEAYKRHLALRECKYFNGAFGSCPFGPHCFYAHRDAQGRDIKHLDRPKRSAKPRRSVGGMTEAALSSLLNNYSNFFRFLEMVEMDEYDSD